MGTTTQIHLVSGTWLLGKLRDGNARSIHPFGENDVFFFLLSRVDMDSMHMYLCTCADFLQFFLDFVVFFSRVLCIFSQIYLKHQASALAR